MQMGTTRKARDWRWRRAMVAGIIGLALPLAVACGGDDDEPDEVTPTKTAGAETPDGTIDDLPTEPGAYAIALYDAWSTNNEPMIEALANDEATEELISSAFDPAEDYRVQVCEQDGDRTACLWRGLTTELRIAVNTAAAQAGERDAVEEVAFEPVAESTPATNFPSNSEDYAQAAVEAWVAGDGDLLADYVSGDVIATLLERPAEAGETWEPAGCEGAAGSVYCTYQTETENLIVRVDNAQAAQGVEDAVVEVRFEER